MCIKVKYYSIETENYTNMNFQWKYIVRNNESILLEKSLNVLIFYVNILRRMNIE